MPSIKKRGGSYLVIVSNGYDNKGKKITKSKTFKKPENMTPKKWEKEINILALEFEKEVEQGIFIDSNITLDEFTDKWFKEYAKHQLQPKTIISYKNELDSKILPALGHIKLNKLNPVKILSFLNNLMEDGIRKDGKPGGYSNRTIKYQWQILSSILHQAVYWQILPDNPCQRVKVPKNISNSNKEFSNTKVKSFNQSQTLVLMDLVKHDSLKYQVAFNIALFCGLRMGEILGLTWNDVDFDNNTLSINKARSYIPGKGMITKDPKVKSSIRILSIPNKLSNLLKEYKLWQNGEKAKCGDQWNKNWEKIPWILTQWDGKGMNYDVLSKWLKKIIINYNKTIENNNSIPKDEKANHLLPVLSFHKLRHTSATLLIGENTDIRTVSHRLGHAQTSTTMNIYVHGLMSTDIKAANALENLLGGEKEVNSISKRHA